MIYFSRVITATVLYWQIHKCASAPLQATSIKDTEVCNRLIEWVLPFDMKNDQVTAIYPEPREEEHILNLKRGIISAFQVSPKGENNVQVVDEVIYIFHSC